MPQTTPMVAERFDGKSPAAMSRRHAAIAALAGIGIAAHLMLRFGSSAPSIPRTEWPVADWPLLVVLAAGGLPLVVELLIGLFRGEFGSDLLAGLSIVTSALLGQHLAGALVVLMLSGGQALEGYAIRRASSVLTALARRMPSVAHRRIDGSVADVPLQEIQPGDLLLVFPHEACPVDGTVIEGHGVMDESYLTGEPYRISKAPGSAVLSGAINGESALQIRADRRPVDSRYARIMRVMQDSEQRRPRMRRLADRLGAFYTPLAVLIAVVAWVASNDAGRFLAVLVVATPCPLLIAIPVAIIGAVSLSASRGIIIRDPAALERIESCRTAIFDKTGTLTYGEPKLTELIPAAGFAHNEVLRLVASVERYSKHPLSAAILEAAESKRLVFDEATAVSERPGEGLTAQVGGRRVRITSRHKFPKQEPASGVVMPPVEGGLECVVLIDDRYAAILRFRDEPRREGAHFVRHLGPQHQFEKVMLVSGDRESEVRYLAEKVGIREVYFSQSPEQKVEIVRRETALAPTVFMGDGINDAPALAAATVGIAFGKNNEITAEAAGVVVLDSSLQKVDEFLHISRRMRSIALQSAIGGMALSLIGMAFAASGLMSPVAGAIAQEIIDVIAVVNALRVGIRPRELSDYE